MQDVTVSQERKSTPVIEGKTFPPIIREPSKLNAPLAEISHYCFEYEYDQGTSSNYYYDGSEEDDSPSYAEDMNRDSTIENLRVTEVDVKSALAHTFNCPESQIPQDLIDLAEKEGFANPDNWEIEVEGGYYGEELGNASVHPEILAKLRGWYYDQADAHDAAGVLEYCRSKGSETTGLTPLEALKAQLTKENPGRTNNRVDTANVIRVAKLKFSKVRVPKTAAARMQQIEARTAMPPAGVKAPKISGIVIQQGNDYILVDGYHRLKSETSVNKRIGAYIILENNVTKLQKYPHLSERDNALLNT
jgi:hypothetical protein